MHPIFCRERITENDGVHLHVEKITPNDAVRHRVAIMATMEMHAKRSYFSAHRAKLYRTDGKRLCEIRLSHSRDNGVLLIDDVEYRAHNEPADRSWCLLRDGVEVLFAFSLREKTPCVVVEQKGDDGRPIARYRIRRAEGPLYEIHNYVDMPDVGGPCKSTSPKDVKSSTTWAEPNSDPSTTTTGTSDYTTTASETTHSRTTTRISPGRSPSSSAGAAELDQKECEASDNVRPTVQVFASRDFPTPKTLPAPGEPLLSALIDAHHLRKYRLQLCEEIPDVILSFLFFFFMLMQKNNPVPENNTTGVTLADEI